MILVFAIVENICTPSRLGFLNIFGGARQVCGSPLVGCSSVSHRTNTKATAAAASRPRRATATWYGLRPFAHPRSLIPPKSHAALVSFNQQYQPSLEANLASLPMLLAVARRCRCRRRATATVATMDAIEGTLAAFSITRLTSSYT